MVVQAGAERLALGTERPETASVLRSIEETGRGALTEMRRLLGMLRGDEPVDLAPAPSLEHLDVLAARVRAAGLPVSVDVVGRRAELPPGVDVSAYRIVQEALTNVIRHAGPARATVTIRYEPRLLELVVADDGQGDGGGSGRGLVGMRERAAVLGGARTLAPDLVLMDVRMPRLDGIEATRRIAGSSCVLVLTTFGPDDYVVGALRAGASGFLLKDAPPEELLAAVHVVARGDALLDPSVTRAVIAELGRRPVPRAEQARLVSSLSPRELQVLRLLARGRSNAEIASDLVVTEGTAKSHVAHVLQKLGVRDRLQAVVLAYEAGAVE